MAPYGTFISPGYPETNYTAGTECYYIIWSPEEVNITLSFNLFEIAGGTKCNDAYVMVSLPYSPLTFTINKISQAKWIYYSLHLTL